MKEEICPQEKIIARAVADKNLSEELLTHLAACAACRQTVEVAGWLRAVDESKIADDTPLPAAQFIWWRARFEREDELKRRAMLPLLIAQIATLILCFMTVVGILIWQRENVERFLFRLMTMPGFMADSVVRWSSAFSLGFCLVALFFAFRVVFNRR